MTTREIWYKILIHVSPNELYQAVTEVKKLAHSWTIDIRGESAIGKRLEFWFSCLRAAEMEGTTLKRGELVKWRVVDGAAGDWIGTEVEFRIFRDQGKTILHFRHSKWHDDAKTFPHCSLGWAIFLCSLKEFVETGKGRPHPYDMSVSLWSPPTDVAV